MLFRSVQRGSMSFPSFAPSQNGFVMYCSGSGIGLLYANVRSYRPGPRRAHVGAAFPGLLGGW